jgi:drug/metabolite transporter (DMT)-like permease
MGLAAPLHGPTYSTIMIALAAFGFGLVPYFAKSLVDAGLPEPMVAFSRYMIAAVVLAPFLKLGREGRTTTAWGVLAGAAMALGWIGYVDALKTVPVAVIGVLYMTYPVFTLGIAWIWFKDRPGRRSLLAATLIVIAAAVSMSPAAVAANAVPVMLISLIAPLCFGFAINILTNKLIHVPPLSRLACVSVGATLGLTPLIATLDIKPLLVIAAGHWWLIGGIAIVTALVPQLLYSVHAPRIGAARTAMAGSVELPTMFLIGWFCFGEDIGLSHLLAAGMVLTAIVITPVRRVSMNVS